MRDSTSVNFPDNLVDYSPTVITGYREAFAAIDADAMYGKEFPDDLWIEPSDWKDWARENDRYEFSWPDDWRIRLTHQGRSHECTSHATIQNAEIAYNRQALTKEFGVRLSALSLYAEANPNQWGGSYMQRVLGIAMERGVLPEDTPEQVKKFPHTLQLTSGRDRPWVPVSRFPSGWRKTAKHFRPTEIINIREWEQHICLILRGFAVSNGRAGHAIPHTKIVWRGNKLYSMYADSYNIHRYDSLSYIKRGVSGAFAITSMAVPDVSWENPLETMN